MSKLSFGPKQKGRSIKRIEPTFDAIRKLWYHYPDLRLGQLLTNVIPQDVDLFYVEEKDLIQYINDYYTEHITRV